ncbi:MAG: saccharopine dehydrogenase family protein [Candidatus Marinimicrobia bacterium]|nr:saccharopine dehydrogenase family protein [Candidatus Neomarinimicrobiota bacterium]
MSKILIIGAGGVGSVVTHKCAQVTEVFAEICLASRTVSKCENIAAQINKPIRTEQVDADNVAELVALINDFRPNLVLNVALPYQDLHIMDACLETGVDYLDTANYEPPNEAKFSYKWQWEYHERFAKNGLMALLGSGFDPGVTNVFTAWAKKKHFDEMHYLDIIDCNAGEHGQPFATNFNPEINIREVSQQGKFYENGKWLETAPLSQFQSFDFPAGIGPKNIYLMYHEELESLVKHFPEIKRGRFWMTFSDQYLNHLKVLQNIGMTSIAPILYEGHEIIPLQFLKAVLPDPGALGPLSKGKTCIGCLIRGIKDGKEKAYYIYNICDHQKCYQEVQSQAVSYTTGVPAMIGAMMMLNGSWRGKGVFNMEQFDPEPFMQKLNLHGLPWMEYQGDLAEILL